MFKLSTFALLTAVLLISIAPQAYAITIIGGRPLPPICSLNLGNQPRPVGPTPSVSVSGSLYFVTVQPACNSQQGTSVAPESMSCAACGQTLEYLVALNGTMYRIVPGVRALAPGSVGATGRSAPDGSSGSEVTVTGFLLAPSGWETNAWTPQYTFAADIMLVSMTAS